MALTIETGLIVANANSYVAVADADAYFADRGNLVWDALDANDAKTPYLIKAVDFMQQAYRRRWRGFRANMTQALDWPRSYVEKFDTPNNYGIFPVGYVAYPQYYDSASIPQEVKYAQMELAVRLANGDLAPDVSPQDTALSTKVGPITIVNSPYAPSSMVFRAVELLLGPLFANTGIMGRVDRA